VIKCCTAVRKASASRHTRVRGRALEPGDRVEVCSPLQAVPDGRAGYRDIGQRRIPCGVIRLRPC